MSNVLTDEARYKAGKSQMGTFLSNQYLMWRIVSAKSIRKIILTADEFYTDILPEEITQDEDVVNNKIRNGWLYEAMAQSEQAIEDLFSLLKNSTDIKHYYLDYCQYKHGMAVALKPFGKAHTAEEKRENLHSKSEEV